MITRVVVRVESGVYRYDWDSKRWVESTDSTEDSVEWKLSGGDISVPVSPGTELDTNQLAGASQISLQATLAGGGDDNTRLFSTSKKQKTEGSQLKLLVYFTRSGTEQDQQEGGKWGITRLRRTKSQE